MLEDLETDERRLRNLTEAGRRLFDERSGFEATAWN